MISRRDFLKVAGAGSLVSATAGCVSSQGERQFEFNLDDVPFTVLVSGTIADGEKAFSVRWSPVLSKEDGDEYYAIPPWKDVSRIVEERESIEPYIMDGRQHWFLEDGEVAPSEWRTHFKENDIELKGDVEFHFVESFELPLTIPFYTISNEFTLFRNGSFTCESQLKD